MVGESHPEVTVTFADPPAPIEQPTVMPLEAPRALRIIKSDLEEHGCTDHCEMCDYFKIYGSRKAGARHTEACRSRLISRFGQTEAGSARLQNWSDKADNTIADIIEHDDQFKTEKAQPKRDVEAEDKSSVQPVVRVERHALGIDMVIPGSGWVGRSY